MPPNTMNGPVSRPLRSALFVDFDNIYSGLASLDRAAATRFATDPGRWLGWLEYAIQRTDDLVGGEPARRILLRHCYLNPQVFAEFRTGFQRAAFRVIDCPPLTRQAKTSTDIHMVMDVLDALGHATHYDEFIILSGDADFTPVLLRLRAHDRRTIVLAVGPAAIAYTNAADLRLSERDLFEELLEREEDGPADVLDRVIAAFEDEAARHGSLDVQAQVAVLRNFDEFRASTNWLGYGGHLRLAQHVCGASPRLALRVVGDGAFFIDHVRQPSPTAPPQRNEAGDQDFRAREVLCELLVQAPNGLEMVALATSVRRRLGLQAPREGGWFGRNSLQAWLADVLPAGWTIVRRSGRQPLVAPPGFVADDSELEHEFPECEDRLQRQIRQATELPALQPDQYRRLFEAIAVDLHIAPYDFSQTGKAVREASGISRATISFVLRGIAQAGLDLRAVGDAATARQLADAFADNVLRMCEAARLELTAEEVEAVRAWVAGRWDGGE